MNKLQNSDKEKLMVKYLLGELSEPEKSLFEERIFDDDDHFAELLAVEDELIAGYIKGELPPDELQGFEQHFLASPRRRERVEIARTLARTIKKLQTGQNPESVPQKTQANDLSKFFAGLSVLKNWALAGAALVVVCGALWFIWKTSELRNEINRLEQESAMLRQQKEEQERRSGEDGRQLAEQLQTEQMHRSESEEQIIKLQREIERLKQQKPVPQPAPASVMTFLLTSGSVRDAGGEKTLRIPTGVQTVVFNLNLKADEFQAYQVSLQTAESREVWQRNNLQARQNRPGSALTFPVPARLLPSGVYIVILNGRTAAGQTELINQYSFSVVNK